MESVGLWLGRGESIVRKEAAKAGGTEDGRKTIGRRGRKEEGEGVGRRLRGRVVEVAG